MTPDTIKRLRLIAKMNRRFTYQQADEVKAALPALLAEIDRLRAIEVAAVEACRNLKGVPCFCGAHTSHTMNALAAGEDGK